MAVTAANFKLYKSATVDDTTSNGGAISANEITSGVDQSIFDDVSDAERQSGDIEYRKVFFKNCSPNDTVSIKCYISQQYSATNQNIAIALATGDDTQAAADDYTYTQPSTLGTGLDLGELVADATKGVWIRRTVTLPGGNPGNGITADQFALTFGMY